MIPGYVAHIYDDPPDEWFWIVHMVTASRLEHEAAYDAPMVTTLAYADRALWERSATTAASGAPSGRRQTNVLE